MGVPIILGSQDSYTDLLTFILTLRRWASVFQTLCLTAPEMFLSAVSEMKTEAKIPQVPLNRELPALFTPLL